MKIVITWNRVNKSGKYINWLSKRKYFSKQTITEIYNKICFSDRLSDCLNTSPNIIINEYDHTDTI